MLVGSANLFLQGVPVTPKKDLDFATDFATARELARQWRHRLTSYCLKLEGDDHLPFPYLFIKQAGHEVEFFDVLDSPGSYYHGTWRPENLVAKEVGGISIQALNLQEELICYRRSGKAEKIAALERFLGVR